MGANQNNLLGQLGNMGSIPGLGGVKMNNQFAGLGNLGLTGMGMGG